MRNFLHGPNAKAPQAYLEHLPALPVLVLANLHDAGTSLRVRNSKTARASRGLKVRFHAGDAEGRHA